MKSFCTLFSVFSFQVCNVAVKVNGEYPLKCASQIFSPDEGGRAFIKLRCYSRQACGSYDNSEDSLRLVGEDVLHTWEELQTLSLSSPCALIQACLLVYKFDHLYNKFGR
jgi:hypothetical protein